MNVNPLQFEVYKIIDKQVIVNEMNGLKFLLSIGIKVAFSGNVWLSLKTTSNLICIFYKPLIFAWSWDKGFPNLKFSFPNNFLKQKSLITLVFRKQLEIICSHFK